MNEKENEYEELCPECKGILKPISPGPSYSHMCVNGMCDVSIVDIRTREWA